LAEPLPGFWLGVSKNVGSIMTYYVLRQNGQIVSCSTVWNVTLLELETEKVKEIFSDFDTEVQRCLKDNDFPVVDSDKTDPELWADVRSIDRDFRKEFFKVYEDTSLPDADDTGPRAFTPKIADHPYINMELALPCGDIWTPKNFFTQFLVICDTTPLTIRHMYHRHNEYCKRRL
jgi:hypothetical protein